MGDLALHYLRPAPRLIPMSAGFRRASCRGSNADGVVDRLGPLAMDTTKKVVQRQESRKQKDLGPVVRPDTVGWGRAAICGWQGVLLMSLLLAER